jgi:hypothetical protein
MKFNRSIFTFLTLVLIISSCQKDFTIDNTNEATGALAKDASGDCAPISIGGIYTTSTILTTANYIDVQVNFANLGTYTITSDTINGYYFHGTGLATTVGLSTVRLSATGTPSLIGTDVFTIIYGTSNCEVNIIVGATTSSTSTFTFGGAPGNCTAANVAGTYTVGTALTSANTVVIQVNVTVLGSYSISTNIVNGLSFSKNGIFTTTGPQTVTLVGSGTPTLAGANNLTIAGTSGCTFIVTVLPGTVVSISGVYVAGNDGGKATIWKNGVPIVLSSTGAQTRSSFISGTDIYACGFVTNASITAATVWKNGVATTLSGTGNYAIANSVFVSGTDVYVAGYEFNGNVFVAKVWKNGVSTSLSNPANFADAKSVFVVGTDVYVAGEDNSTAVLWKNGIPTSLTNGSVAYSVYVVGTDVYVAGVAQGAGVGATLWKNGISTSLSSAAAGSRANAVFVLGNDVFVAGSEINANNKSVAKVWKNGVATTLTNGIENAETTSVFVLGTDVYVSGAEYGPINQLGSQTYIAKYWKNGVATSLTDGLSTSKGYGILVR